ncbi:MAG: hypothetical protein ACQRW7_05910 [Caulobacterales bacterium]|uniref:hypothetical protein n=1 Tax=Glycocaulis sp. TaxID=1969725 RepID=UPI003F9ECEF1
MPMHLAIGTTIATALAGLAASTMMTMGPQAGTAPALVPASSVEAIAPGNARFQLAQGEAYLRSLRQGTQTAAPLFVVEVGAGSELAARFVTTRTALVRSEDVRIDAVSGDIVYAGSDTELLARQSEFAVPVSRYHAGDLQGAGVITDQGHDFGEVDTVRRDASGDIHLSIRMAGASSATLEVPQACASIVPETGLVIVRTCNLSQI